MKSDSDSESKAHISESQESKSVPSEMSRPGNRNLVSPSRILRPSVMGKEESIQEEIKVNTTREDILEESKSCYLVTTGHKFFSDNKLVLTAEQELPNFVVASFGSPVPTTMKPALKKRTAAIQFNAT